MAGVGINYKYLEEISLRWWKCAKTEFCDGCITVNLLKIFESQLLMNAFYGIKLHFNETITFLKEYVD